MQQTRNRIQFFFVKKKYYLDFIRVEKREKNMISNIEMKALRLEC
jgi:hypothetical protein